MFQDLRVPGESRSTSRAAELSEAKARSSSKVILVKNLQLHSPGKLVEKVVKALQANRDRRRLRV